MIGEFTVVFHNLRESGWNLDSLNHQVRFHGDQESNMRSALWDDDDIVQGTLRIKLIINQGMTQPLLY